MILVAPVVYTGLELAQAHLLSGMTMGCLEHSQYRWTTLIQISDLTGCYGVTFLMMFVAACLARMVPADATNPKSATGVPGARKSETNSKDQFQNIQTGNSESAEVSVIWNLAH